jgi:hypothetical protein
MTITKPAGICFDDMISLLRCSDHGKVLDSFARVEMGEHWLRTAWEAFKDIADYFDEEYFGDTAMLNQFLLMIEDDVRFSDCNLKPYL